MTAVPPELIAQIKEAALNLPIACEDSVFLDKLLGGVEALIHEARQLVDDEWRALRAESQRHYHKPLKQTLEDLI